MDLGVLLTDVTSFATTTLSGFGVIIASFIGLGMVFTVIGRFIRR